MKQTSLILLVILTVFLNKIYAQSSPCPNIFQYQYDGQRNYGIVTIPGPGVGRTVIQAKIAIRGPIYNRGTGGLRLLKSLNSAVEDAKRGNEVQYILNFPQSQQLPTLMKLTLNNRDICNGPEVYNAPTWTYQHEFTYPSGVTQLSFIPFNQIQPEEPQVDPSLDRNPWLFPNPTPRFTPPTTPPSTPPPTPATVPAPTTRERARPNDGSWLSSLPFAGTCGRKPTPKNVLEATHLIIGGEDVIRGEFPWMVALFHYNGNIREYKCGASLISNTYVITAAHCTVNQRKVYLELGKHDISNPFEDGYIPRVSLEIYAHPEYVPDKAHGDVSLILIERVQFTAKIWPICLWAYGTRLDNIVRTGTVTGWGRVENDGAFSVTPKKLEVRTTNLDTCRLSDDLFIDLAADTTFCARGNNTGPCHGDSGSGFYIIHQNTSYLRGIISTSLGNKYVCNLSKYAVYADLAYYLDWLRPYLTS